MRVTKRRNENTIKFSIGKGKPENFLKKIEKLDYKKLFRKFHYSKLRGRPKTVQIIFEAKLPRASSIAKEKRLKGQKPINIYSQWFPDPPPTPKRVKDFLYNWSYLILKEKIMDVNEGSMILPTQFDTVTLRYIY